MSDPYQHVVFCSDNPPIVMMYDSRNGVHSIWKIRKAQQEVSFVLLTQIIVLLLQNDLIVSVLF